MSTQSESARPIGATREEQLSIPSGIALQAKYMYFALAVLIPGALALSFFVLVTQGQIESWLRISVSVYAIGAMAIVNAFLAIEAAPRLRELWSPKTSTASELQDESEKVKESIEDERRKGDFLKSQRRIRIWQITMDSMPTTIYDVRVAVPNVYEEWNERKAILKRLHDVNEAGKEGGLGYLLFNFMEMYERSLSAIYPTQMDTDQLVLAYSDILTSLDGFLDQYDIIYQNALRAGALEQISINVNPPEEVLDVITNSLLTDSIQRMWHEIGSSGSHITQSAEQLRSLQTVLPGSRTWDYAAFRLYNRSTRELSSNPEPAQQLAYATLVNALVDYFRRYSIVYRSV